ncbi:glycoside hydrolase family 36 N-terminal domain-containing protein [Amycolatopsis nalaikhensis]|uniref:Glycoside hydrolase family 36 N-terminal domain-containing protein n=1 Tax=Amycolatopsis nalaikhensis TaxID=715472 RepID=A0ABY8X9A0_9PSEU|nr:glycoside hydrolase family 36 N-terminal domain-containing protein [Amycolatopsis sp. 2-2]WIV52972.1 glycoside hydrolase family 36 N-terminal domain-containing protein [Amycolatopsis sp. 2-2]
MADRPADRPSRDAVRPDQSVVDDPAARLWLLRTPLSGYVLMLDSTDVPRAVHGGVPLTLEQARGIAVPERRPDSGDPGPDPGAQEYAVEGGTRSDAPSLQLRYEDGGWGVSHSAAWSLPVLGGYRVHQVSGAQGSEFKLRRTELAIGEMAFTSRLGHTGHRVDPWSMIDDGTAAEEHGEVWSGVLAWSGSRRITLSRDPAGRAGFTGGPTWRLDPGAELETRVFAGMYAPDGFGGASRRRHQHIRGHVLPAPERTPLRLFNSWEADGWFGARTGERPGLGDWQPSVEFGIRVEPEMVDPDSDLPFSKGDFKRPFAGAGWPGDDDPDRLWIDHVRGVYALIDPRQQRGARLDRDPARLQRAAPARRTRSAVLGLRPSGGDRLATQLGDPVERAAATGRPRPVGDLPRGGRRPGPPRSRGPGARVVHDVLSPRLPARAAAPGQGSPG